MTIKYCPKCGAQIKENSRFCHQCGAIINWKEITPERDNNHYRIGIQEQRERGIEEQEHYYLDENSSTRTKKVKKSNGLKVIAVIAIALIASVAILTPISLLIAFGPLNYQYLESTNYTYEPTTIASTELEIYNQIGEVSIVYDNELSNLFDATIDIFGRKKADPNQAKTFQDSIITEGSNSSKVKISFDSGIYLTGWLNPTALKYKITVRINPEAYIDFNVETSSGDISINNDGYSELIKISRFWFKTGSGDITATLPNNLKISNDDFKMKTSSGSINLNIGDNSFFEIDNFTIETGSGDINIQYGSSVTIISNYMIISTSSGSNDHYLDHNNTIMTSQLEISTGSGDIEFDVSNGAFLLEASTVDFSTSSGQIWCELPSQTNITLSDSLCLLTGSGDIHFDFGSNTIINCPVLFFHAVSGQIEIYCNDVEFVSTFTWQIQTGSGDILLELNPSIGISTSYEATFEIETASGSIEILHEIDMSSIGIKINADNVSGDINIPGGNDYYQSDSYDSKEIKYDFSLDTGSGDITFH
jgi:hypothetical protein